MWSHKLASVFEYSQTNIYQKHYEARVYICLVSESLCSSSFGSFVEDTEYREECLLCLGELKGEEDML